MRRLRTQWMAINLLWYSTGCRPAQPACKPDHSTLARLNKMGITISYRGSIADLDRVEDMEDRVIDWLSQNLVAPR